MQRREVTLGLIGGSAGLAFNGKGTAMARQADLAQRVGRLVDDYAAAWNASDMDAMAALYADDVHWVNIVGMHWQGRAQVDHAHRAYFETMFKGVPMTLEEIESITPLAGGGAIVVVRWAVGAFRTPAGHANPPSRNRMSLVLVERDDRLLIAHGANIAIVEDAQRFDPAK